MLLMLSYCQNLTEKINKFCIKAHNNKSLKSKLMINNIIIIEK